VKVRSERDLEILKNSDMGVEEMLVWTRELFTGEGSEKFRIPENLLNYGFEIMTSNFNKAKDGETRKMILRKILHTKEVVMAGIEIMEKEKSVEWNPYMVGAVTFAHDFGRFPQALLGSFSDTKTGFDHASEGARLIEKKNFSELASMGIDIKVLAETVRQHSRLEYRGKEVYVKFIRDADKLGLLDFFHNDIDEFKVPWGSVTKGAIEAFLDGRLVPKEDLVNRIDVFLCWLSWQFDFNFAATRELVESRGTRDYILEEIKKMDEDVWSKVINYQTKLTPKSSWPG
jgi:hypothetical protein